MSSPLQFLNACELRGLISLLNKERVLPLDLIDVPSKLEAALGGLTNADSLLIDSNNMYHNYPTFNVDQYVQSSVDDEFQETFTFHPITPLRNRGGQGLITPDLTINPRRLFSPPSPHRGAPYLGDPFLIRPNFFSGDPVSSPVIFPSRRNHLQDSPSILGRRDRSSSPCSTPRNRRRLAFGSHILDDVNGSGPVADTVRGTTIETERDAALGTEGSTFVERSTTIETTVEEKDLAAEGETSAPNGMSNGSTTKIINGIKTPATIKSRDTAAETMVTETERNLPIEKERHSSTETNRGMTTETENITIEAEKGEVIPTQRGAGGEGDSESNVDAGGDGGIDSDIVEDSDDGVDSDYNPAIKQKKYGTNRGRERGHGLGNGQGQGTDRNHGRGQGEGIRTGASAGQAHVANLPRVRQCPTRGGAAPPVWIYDPRAALDADLVEEQFQRFTGVPTGDQMWQIGNISREPSIHPEPENQVLSSPGYHFVLDLALACRKFIFCPPGEENPIAEILKLLKTAAGDSLQLARNDSASRLGSIMAVDSLQNIADRCGLAEQSSNVMDFVFMINAIQLRSKVISVCHAKGWKKTHVLESIKGVRSPRTLARYVSDAAKFCLLAGGGTLFILAVAAAANTRSAIRNSLTHDIVLRINYLLRCPNPAHNLGQLVIQDIIPVIDLLRKQFRATFSSMFNQELLFSHGVIPEIEVGDLQRSDEFFDSITYNAFIKHRSVHTWASCYLPLDGTIPVIPFYVINHAVLSSTPTTIQLPSTSNYLSIDSIPSPLSSPDDDEDLDLNSQPSNSSGANMYTIKTKFNPSLERNIKVQYKDKADKKRHNFTEKERGYAEKATKCATLEDLHVKLTKQLNTGKKTKARYLNITHETLQGKRLRITDINDEILLLAFPDLPRHLRERLLIHLKAACPDKLKWTDSEAEKEFFQFLALHFCWWNRYSTSGEGAPSDKEPATLRKEGIRRPNTSTFVPRTSKEFQQHMEEYKRLEECFQDIFAWINVTLKEILPAEYTVIGQYADILPGDGFSPAYPFSGFVINFNVCTRIHRDMNDKKLCIVMAIADDDCEGGDICFLEPGIRLQLLSGDMVLFPSAKISHFNMNFKGQRASLVLHSDGSGDNWVKDRNNWRHNIYMHEVDHL